MSNIPAFIKFTVRGVDEKGHGHEDGITEHDLLEMKGMVGSVKVNPLLLYQFFSLPANVLSGTVLQIMTGAEVMRRSSIQSSRSEPTLYHMYSGLEENVCEHEEKITDQDIVDMKEMIQNIRIDPSLYYEKFDLPWTVDDSLEESPSCVVQANPGPLGLEIPRLPSMTERELEGGNDASSSSKLITPFQRRGGYGLKVILHQNCGLKTYKKTPS